MSKNNHTEFIKSPIIKILKDVVTASTGIGSGIETYPLCDYIMQSVFLKMTGFQEQKMKCICWELATNDYEYRYEFTQNKLGECSSYKDKNAIYKDLIEQIEKHIPKFKVSTDVKQSILTDTISELTNIFAGTNLSIWAQNYYNEFSTVFATVSTDWFLKDKNALFEGQKTEKLQLMYECLYKHRNRCAHNTLSYQQNLPTLKTLADENYQYENYFIRFAILILIDKIFIALYNRYLEAIEDKI